MPEAPQDLTRHDCLGFPEVGTWTPESGVTSTEVKICGHYVLNSVGMFRTMATLHQGIILLPRAAVAEELAAGRLRQILSEWQGRPQPVYALTETRLLPAKTQRFIEYVLERLAKIV